MNQINREYDKGYSVEGIRNEVSAVPKGIRNKVSASYKRGIAGRGKPLDGVMDCFCDGGNGYAKSVAHDAVREIPRQWLQGNVM